MKFNQKKVLAVIKPSVAEERSMKKIAAEFLNKIKKDLAKHKATAVLGGSVGKGTWLQGNHDIDIFIQFENDEGISDILEKVLKKNFYKAERIHGSRDYFRIKFNGFSFEIVPVFKIKKINEARNVTDCSIFHIKWVAKNSAKVKDEIRLVKQFCKANRVYGAETFIKGFSGYVLEILTVYFGSFNKFVKGMANLKEGTVIDMSKHKKALDRNKLSPIILIDPVQADRNAAAALSQEKFEKLKHACIMYLKNPSADYFTIKKQEPAKLEKKYDIVLEINATEGKDDVVGTRMLKALEYIYAKLNKEGFIVEKPDWAFEEPAYAWFNVKNKEIEKEYMHYGPPIKAVEHVESFREKYKGFSVHEEKGRLVVKLKREFHTVDGFLNNLLKDEYIRERVKSIKRVQ